MREAEVRAALLDGGFVLKKWDLPCESSLKEVIETVGHVKQSINDYLTQLIDCNLKDEVELSDASDPEEEAGGDSVSGFIKRVPVVDRKAVSCEKRRIDYSCNAKKIKK